MLRKIKIYNRKCHFRSGMCESEEQKQNKIKSHQDSIWLMLCPSPYPCLPFTPQVFLSRRPRPRSRALYSTWQSAANFEPFKSELHQSQHLNWKVTDFQEKVNELHFMDPNKDKVFFFIEFSFKK